jgi:hypothetical protein
MTRDGDSEKVNGVKDKTMTITKEKIERLIDTLKYALCACTALDHVRELQDVGKEVPEDVERVANELLSTVPGTIALELLFWGNEAGGLKMEAHEFGMMHHWIQQINDDMDADDDDE